MTAWNLAVGIAGGMWLFTLTAVLVAVSIVLIGSEKPKR